MLICFRTDASYVIGSGHVMRCLTLADALSELGNKVVFICKDHNSNLINKIINSGYEVKVISVSLSNDVNSQLTHAEWLGGTQEEDADKTLAAIELFDVDWMIVDHYAIDEFWHKRIRPHVKRTFVIDDLGDRKHHCDILLDQNLGATLEKYQDIVPENCELLLGPQYALLRPEFAQWRNKTIERRRHVKIPKNILVSLGGVDSQNITTNVINELSKLSILADVEVNVVLGSQSPHINAVEIAAQKALLKVNVHVDSIRMAELMSQADLAIGSSGSSSWERCALGLPAINFVIAENQIGIALALESAEAAITIRGEDELSSKLNIAIQNLKKMSIEASLICDGSGVKRVSNSFRI